jgi:hypothetical protein
MRQRQSKAAYHSEGHLKASLSIVEWASGDKNVLARMMEDAGRQTLPNS